MLGVGIVYAAALATCYYWVMLLLVPLGRGRWRPTAVWLVLNAGLAGLHLLTARFEIVYGATSWVVGLFLLGWIAPDVAASLRELAGRPGSRGESPEK